MSKFLHCPEPTITKKVATELAIDYALAQRLVAFYNTFLYQDVPGARSRKGHKQTQVLLGLGNAKLAHLQDIAVDGSHKHTYLVNCMLAAAGYHHALGNDAILSTLLK